MDTLTVLIFCRVLGLSRLLLRWQATPETICTARIVSWKKNTNSEIFRPAGSPDHCGEESVSLDPRSSNGLEEYGARSIGYSFSRCKGVHYSPQSSLTNVHISLGLLVRKALSLLCSKETTPKWRSLTSWSPRKLASTASSQSALRRTLARLISTS